MILWLMNIGFAGGGVPPVLFDYFFSRRSSAKWHRAGDNT